MTRELILLKPFEIGSRLLPALHIGDGWIALEHIGQAEGRCVYRYYIDIPAGEFAADDIRSGMNAAAGEKELQEAFGCLLSFLSAAVEAYSYKMRSGSESENINLFPLAVIEWAYQHSDEISILQYEIEEGQALILKDE